MAEENLSFENIDSAAGYGILNAGYTPIDEGAAAAGQESQEQQEQETEKQPADGGQQEVGNQESVGGEQQQEQGAPDQGDGEGSSSANFYSSVADALMKEGALEFLSADDIAAIKDPESFKEAFMKEVKGYRTESENMLMEALGLGADVQQLNDAQQTYDFLSKIDPNSLDNDSEQGIADLRHDLIVNHFIAKGFTQEQAEYEFTKSRDTNNDIKDAKFALESQKQYFKSTIDNIMNDARQREQTRQQEMQQRQQRVTDNIMNNDGVFGGIQLDKRIRTRIVDAIYAPKVKGNDGAYYSELQAYQNEHPDEFLQLMGMVYVLTDNGKNISKLADTITKKERNNNIKNLENVLRGQRGGDGSLRFVANGRPEKEIPEAARYKPAF